MQSLLDDINSSEFPKFIKSNMYLTAGMTESNCRPPWFDTMMASTPCSTANLASSPVRMPFKMSFILVCLEGRDSQVRDFELIYIIKVKIDFTL